jgi:hypothetical protein
LVFFLAAIVAVYHRHKKGIRLTDALDSRHFHII